MPINDRPPGRLLRLLFRAPVPLYRAGLGWLLGRRFLYLAHRGRSSGLRRETALEVVRYDRRTGEAVVVAAWGERAQWYRNILSAPALEVRIGRRRYLGPRQRLLSAAELGEVLTAYRRDHPLAIRILARNIGWPVDGTREQWEEFVEGLRAVAFRPGNAEVV